MSGSLSGVTPVSSGSMRKRHSQGFASSSSDLEDDACSRPAAGPVTSVPRARTWVEATVNIVWLTSAAFIVYYGDRRSNMVSILWQDGRIRRIPLCLGLLSVVSNLGLVLYSTLKSRDLQKSHEKSESLHRTAPYVIMLGSLSYCLFSFALWPVWSFLTIPLLFTLLIALIIISPYLLIGPLKPQAFMLHADQVLK